VAERIGVIEEIGVEDETRVFGNFVCDVFGVGRIIKW